MVRGLLSNVFLYLAIFEPFLYGTGFFYGSLEDVMILLIMMVCSLMLETLVVSIGDVKRTRRGIGKVFTKLFGCRAIKWLLVHILCNSRIKYL